MLTNLRPAASLQYYCAYWPSTVCQRWPSHNSLLCFVSYSCGFDKEKQEQISRWATDLFPSFLGVKVCVGLYKTNFGGHKRKLPCKLSMCVLYSRVERTQRLIYSTSILTNPPLSLRCPCKEVCRDVLPAINHSKNIHNLKTIISEINLLPGKTRRSYFMSGNGQLINHSSVCRGLYSSVEFVKHCFVGPPAHCLFLLRVNHW